MQSLCGKLQGQCIALSGSRYPPQCVLDPIAGLQPLRALQMLSLSNNECSSLDGIQQCPALTAVDASQNRLPSFPLFSLPQLRKLCLSSNR